MNTLEILENRTAMDGTFCLGLMGLMVVFGWAMDAPEHAHAGIAIGVSCALLHGVAGAL